MIQIPKQFNLLGHTIKVNVTPNFRLIDGNLGEANYSEGSINLQGNTKEFPVSKEMLEHTYLHEVIHFVLYFMGNEELREDEGFVDLFAGLLHQALQTQKGEWK
jgi:predicted SprT family Zn-dependent metalloprotease